MKNDAEQFEFEDDLKLIDGLLKQALKAQKPEHLGEAVFSASLQEFKLIELDQKLQKALAFTPSVELKARLLHGINEEQELDAFEKRVADGLRPDAPAGLSEMIYKASCEELKAQALDHQLIAHLQTQPPMGLADRIFQATHQELDQQEDQPAVIAQIGMKEEIFGWARAACIMMGISIGLWLIVTAITPRNYVGTDEQYAQTPVEMLMQDDESILAMEAEVFDIGLDDLSAELAELNSDEAITSLTSLDQSLDETESLFEELGSWQ